MPSPGRHRRCTPVRLLDIEVAIRPTPPPAYRRKPALPFPEHPHFDENIALVRPYVLAGQERNDPPGPSQGCIDVAAP